jgi:hypothetical protein
MSRREKNIKVSRGGEVKRGKRKEEIFFERKGE